MLYLQIQDVDHHPVGGDENPHHHQQETGQTADSVTADSVTRFHGVRYGYPPGSVKDLMLRLNPLETAA
jgi:hypothetical protein